jgi:anionic glutamate receptor
VRKNINRANNPRVNFREKEKKILDQILGAGKYDARIRPSGINGTGECRKQFTLQKYINKYNITIF